MPFDHYSTPPLVPPPQGEEKKRRILILGGAGFIGSALARELHRQGDEVTIFDTLFYEPAPRDFSPMRLVRGDIRSREDLEAEIERADAVVHLAALSNDPVADLDPELTWEINHRANSHIAELCARHGKRVIFASSCSVYGFARPQSLRSSVGGQAESGIFNEESPLNPLSLYAQTKALSEKVYEEIGGDSVCLRLATAYGYSEKPRFDLVVNNMIGDAHFGRNITVHGGEQWRPLVHVRDIARAIILALRAEKLRNRVYNIGSNDQNFQIIDLARTIISHFPGATLGREDENLDPRSYRVDFSRAVQELGFQARYTIADSVKEFLEAFQLGKVPHMQNDEYYRVRYLKNNLVPSLKI